MIDTHKEILYLVKQRKWKQNKAEDLVGLVQRQSEKSYENLATKTDIAVLEGDIKGLKGDIKALDTKLNMFMWFITIGVALIELLPYITKIINK